MFGQRPSKKQRLHEQDLDLCCETLEPRQMLAGDVMASLSNSGVLTITGNRLDNSVDVYRDGSKIYVEADSYDGEGEFVSENDFEFDAIDVSKIKVRLRGGSDYLTIDENYYGSYIDVDVNLGGKYDHADYYGDFGDIKSVSDDSYFEVNADGLIVRGSEVSTYYADAESLSARLKGSAYVNVYQTYIGEMVDINSGGGNDNMYFQYSTLGELDIKTGGGNDYLYVYDSDFNEDVSVKTGGGEDEIYVSGYYYYGYYNYFYGDVDVKLGGGDDDMSIDYSYFYDSEVSTNGNGGFDELNLYNVNFYGESVLNEPKSFEEGNFDEE